ncbi:MAG: SufD family Fe-S cluster assembly protein [Rickettsiales bacterium]
MRCDSFPVSCGPEGAAQDAARRIFAERGFPDKSVESWRYAKPFLTAPAHILAYASVSRPRISASRCDVYDAACLPEGLLPAFLPLFVSEAPDARFPLTRENAFFMAEEGDATAVWVKAGESARLSLEYHDANEGASRRRLYVVAEEGASLTLTEKFSAAHGTCATSLAHIVLKKGATCRHYAVQNVSNKAYALQRVEVVAQENASYNAFRLHAGGLAHKCDMIVRLEGERARADELVIATAGKGEYRDVYMPVYHHARNAHSAQTVRQAPMDEGTCVYYGAAYVPPEGAGAKASQLNRNVLLGKKAKALGRPELHILTDDVRCSHGSATGSLDEAALYYLQSRGIERADALWMMLEAFLTPDAGALSDVAMREEVARIVRERFCSGE